MVRRFCIEMTRLDVHEALFLGLGQFSFFLRLGCSRHFLKTIGLWVTLRIDQGLFLFVYVHTCVYICVSVSVLCVKTETCCTHVYFSISYVEFKILTISLTRKKLPVMAIMTVPTLPLMPKDLLNLYI